ncbi:MAG: YfhO family protein [Anaerolineales bacterium]
MTGRVLVWGTPPTQFIPWWWQAWQTLASGELPLWNPLLGMGAPLIANYQSALFYPPTWTLFAAAALGGLRFMAWGLSILVAAHLALAGWGMLSLLAKLKLGEFAQTIGGLAFSLSGFLVAHAQFISIHFAISWLPWILLATFELVTQPGSRRPLLKLAAFFAMQWLAGHAQISWYTFLLTVAWTAFWVFQQSRRGTWRKVALSFGLAALLGFLLSAVQLLPTAEYLLQSQRSAGVDRAAALFSSFWPWRFIGLVAPNFFGNPASGNFSGYANYWEDAIYIGLIPLGLALSSLFNLNTKSKFRSLRVFLAGLVLVSLLFALGSNTPIFPWLFDHVPTFDMFRGPTRYSIWAIFALSLLAAIAADRWKPNAKSRSRTLRLSRVPSGRGAQFLICGLLAADLLYAGWGLSPAGSPDLYKLEANDHAELRTDLAGARLYLPAADEAELRYGNFLRPSTFFSADPLALRTTLLPNTNLLDQISSVNNYDPFVPARFREWMNKLEDADSVLKPQLLAIMNVSAIEHVLHDQGASVFFERMIPLPRARWVNCARLVENRDQALNLTFSGDLHVGHETVVEAPGEEAQVSCGSGQAGSADLVSSRNGQVEIAVNAPGGGWLLLADIWYPGWVAEVNGEALPLFPAYGIIRAVLLSPGQYSVIFSYRPISFYIGLTLSLAALAASIVLWRRWYSKLIVPDV